MSYYGLGTLRSQHTKWQRHHMAASTPWPSFSTASDIAAALIVVQVIAAAVLQLFVPRQ